MGDKTNIITKVRTAAKKHADNVAVQALIRQLDIWQQHANNVNVFGTQIDPLAGYAKGTTGEDGYSLLLHLDPTRQPMDSFMERMFAMHKVAVIVDCLAIILSELGEETHYATNMGRADSVRNPKYGWYMWTLDEVLQAMKDDIVDGFTNGKALFSDTSWINAKRFHDRELGERVREKTLTGFHVLRMIRN